MNRLQNVLRPVVFRVGTRPLFTHSSSAQSPFLAFWRNGQNGVGANGARFFATNFKDGTPELSSENSDQAAETGETAEKEASSSSSSGSDSESSDSDGVTTFMNETGNSSNPELVVIPLLRRPLFPGQTAVLMVTHPDVMEAIYEAKIQGKAYVGLFLRRNPPEDAEASGAYGGRMPTEEDDVLFIFSWNVSSLNQYFANFNLSVHVKIVFRKSFSFSFRQVSLKFSGQIQFSCIFIHGRIFFTSSVIQL